MSVPLAITIVCALGAWGGVGYAWVLRRRSQACAAEMEDAFAIARWARTHRLMVDDPPGGKWDVAIADLMAWTTFTPVPGVAVLPQRDAFGLYDCPRCTDAVLNLVAHLRWCKEAAPQ